MTHHRIHKGLLVPLVAASLIPLAACANEDSAGPEKGASLNEVASDQIGIDPFLGNTVTVSGKVTDATAGDHGFRLSGEDWGGEPLRVVDAAGATVSEGDLVKVTGVVRQYEETAIENDYGVTLDDGVFDDWNNDHVLVATQVDPSIP